MNDDGIAASHKAHQQFQLRPFGIFAGCFVGKGFVNRNAIQLPLSMLIKCANANIPNTLSNHRALPEVSS
jgi:hypothetical protein